MFLLQKKGREKERRREKGEAGIRSPTEETETGLTHVVEVCFYRPQSIFATTGNLLILRLAHTSLLIHLCESFTGPESE